jgi:hypothetical protein
VVSEAPSKSEEIRRSLIECGFESEGEQGGTEVWKHRDLHHVVELDLSTGVFNAVSGWNSASKARGDNAEDLMQFVEEEN